MTDKQQEPDADPETRPQGPDPHADRRRAESIGAFHGFIGRSPAIMAVFHKIAIYAPAEAPVLIQGETGTGKDLVARALHMRSRRAEKPFVALNCTALNEELFESELFGHEKGAFTGAVRTHKGRFERADRGTLFLDEIGEMSMRVQAKMLRALEEGLIERVGGETEHRVDVRAIAATNIPLDRAVQLRRFRADLFHRISVFRILVPPLRERRGDIALLVRHFLALFNQRYGRKIQRLTPEAMRFLDQYAWPGNIRELRNVLERVYVESRTDIIGRNAFVEWERERDCLAAGSWDVPLLEQQRMTGPILIVPTGSETEKRAARPQQPDAPGHLPPTAQPAPSQATPDYPIIPAAWSPETNLTAPPPPTGPIDVDFTVEAPRPRRGPLTEEIIRKAFWGAHGNATRAAASLGVHKTTLYRNMKRLGLSRPDLEQPIPNDPT